MKMVAFALCAMICVAVSAAFVSAAPAEVTLKGKATCAKCDLKTASACQAALVVTEDGKEVVYYVAGDKGKDLHHEVCQAPKDGVSITGVVSEKAGQKWITPTKIEG
jgi:hypothetical protein